MGDSTSGRMNSSDRQIPKYCVHCWATCPPRQINGSLRNRGRPPAAALFCPRRLVDLGPCRFRQSIQPFVSLAFHCTDDSIVVCTACAIIVWVRRHWDAALALGRNPFMAPCIRLRPVVWHPCVRPLGRALASSQTGETQALVISGVRWGREERSTSRGPGGAERGLGE
eukprot:gene13494-biopygen4841